jgi:hypothetical protein
VADQRTRIIEVTKEEWLKELLFAIWRQIGIVDIEKDDIE